MNLLSTTPIGLKSCSNQICNASDQFPKEIQNIYHLSQRSPKYAELGHFKQVLQRTAKKCTKIYNARAQLLFCSLHLLFGEVLVAVAVVVCLRSLIYQTRETVCFIGISKYWEENWKYDARRGIFVEFPGVWIADKTLSRVFDISSQWNQKLHLRSKRKK